MYKGKDKIVPVHTAMADGQARSQNIKTVFVAASSMGAYMHVHLYTYQRSLKFFYSCAELLLQWAEHFYATWRLRGTLKDFCNMHNKNIYNENWKIPGARQQFSVSRSISATAWPRTRAG
jgi:hypothetical protein